MIHRLKFGHLKILLKTLLVLVSFQSFGLSDNSETQPAEKKPFMGSRSPANFIPDDEQEPAPIEQTMWLQGLLIEDDSGVLVRMRKEIQAWERLEEWRDLWNLKSTGLFKVPTRGEKRSYLEKNLLKYADKRLSGEVRNAEQGSVLHQAGQVQKALRPKAEVSFSKLIKVKLRARVLQGLVVVKVNNPWVESYANVKVNGDVNVHLNRKIASLEVDAGIDYNVKEGVWLARVDRSLTSEITARISSTQKDDKMIFAGSADNRIHLFYHLPF